MAKDKVEKPPLTVREMAALGGHARAKGLSKKRRKEIAKAGAAARWGDKKAAASTSSNPQSEES